MDDERARVGLAALKAMEGETVGGVGLVGSPLGVESFSIGLTGFRVRVVARYDAQRRAPWLDITMDDQP